VPNTRCRVIHENLCVSVFTDLSEKATQWKDERAEEKQKSVNLYLQNSFF